MNHVNYKLSNYMGYLLNGLHEFCYSDSLWHTFHRVLVPVSRGASLLLDQVEVTSGFFRYYQGTDNMKKTSINNNISEFFREKVKFLRPISPMAAIIGSIHERPDPDSMYSVMAEVESRTLGLKSSMNDQLNGDRPQGTPVITEPLIVNFRI